MIHIRPIGPSDLPLYDTVDMLVHIDRIYQIEKIDRGLGGFRLRETPVPAYVKDMSRYERAQEYAQRFDITNWGFFLALDGDRPVGACTLAARTPGVEMLDGREDLAVLWDLRVSDGYKRQGIGQRLFDQAVAWCRVRGFSQLKIESQNVNVPACRFYHKQGAVLSAVNEYAYYAEEDIRGEAQLLWYLSL